MQKSTLLGASFAFIFLFTSSASAALVTTIDDLYIDGMFYDVVFHTGSGDSFTGLWDSDQNGTFGDDVSMFNAEPTFWWNENGAHQAAIAIAAYLGTTDTTTIFGDDGFIVPFGYIGGSATFVNGWFDLQDPGLDLQYGTGWSTSVYDINYPYASFTASTVPVPAAMWLFGSGLLGLMGIARHRKA